MSENEDENTSINNDDRSEHNNRSSPINSVPTDFLYPLYEQHSSRARRSVTDHAASSTTFPNPTDFLHPLYQQAIARQFRSSDQLLGELVTSELIKMPKDRKKTVQKKILEILFFDDE